MDCTADLLLVLVWDETATGTARSKTETRYLSSAMLLLAVPEAVSSHTKARSRDKLCSSFSVLLLAVPEAVLSHTKTRRISSRCIYVLREKLQQLSYPTLQSDAVSKKKGGGCGCWRFKM
jgi:hypothetical protein